MALGDLWTNVRSAANLIAPQVIVDAPKLHADAIEQAIALYRPNELAELRFNTGPDHSGDSAIWIWAFLTDVAAESDERFLENVEQLREILDAVARAFAPDRWPCFSFRSIAEQAETMEASSAFTTICWNKPSNLPGSMPDGPNRPAFDVPCRLPTTHCSIS